MRACYRSHVWKRRLQQTATYAVQRARKELKHPVGKAVGIAVLVLLGLAGWYVFLTLTNPLVLNAPPPAVAADLPDSAPPLPASVVEAPITYDMSTAME